MQGIMAGKHAALLPRRDRGDDACGSRRCDGITQTLWGIRGRQGGSLTKSSFEDLSGSVLVESGGKATGLKSRYSGSLGVDVIASSLSSPSFFASSAPPLRCSTLPRPSEAPRIILAWSRAAWQTQQTSERTRSARPSAIIPLGQIMIHSGIWQPSLNYSEIQLFP